MSALLEHLERDNCCEEINISAMSDILADCKERDDVIRPHDVHESWYSEEVDGKSFFCLICKDKFRLLSGLLRHAETSECGLDMEHSVLVELVERLDVELRKL